MAKKKREKTISIEELKEKLITSSTQNWLNGEPQCAILPTPEGPKILWLYPKDTPSIVVLFLLDVGDYTTDRVFEQIVKWRDKYKKLSWKPIISFQQKYSFVKHSKFLERYKAVPQFNKIPIYYDPLGEWFEQYQTKDQPHLLFFNQDNLVFKEPLLPDFSKMMDQAENQFQEILRMDDPGLPLIDVQVSKTIEPTDKKFIPPESLTQMGRWVPANRSLVTEDTQAALSFPFEGKYLRLIGATHPQAREGSRIQVSLNNEPLPIPVHGEHVHMNEKGVSIMDINRTTGIYELIASEDVLKGTIQLKFLNALENPAIIYELRAG